MTEISWWSAIWAGIVGTAVMTTLMYMAKAMGMRMDMPRMLGLMFAPPERSGAVYGMGLAARFTMGALFAVIYAWIFAWAGWQATAFRGGLVGAVHGGVAAGRARGQPRHLRRGSRLALRRPSRIAAVQLEEG